MKPVMGGTVAAAISIYADIASISRDNSTAQWSRLAPGRLATGARPIIEIISTDERSAAPAGDAAALWNSFHPHFAGQAIQTSVKTVPQDQISDTSANIVGIATCWGTCPMPGAARWCCGRSELKVVDSLTDEATFDVFFHEIGHLVIPPGAVAFDNQRYINDGGHWHPEEPHEIMGATLEFPVTISAYTAAAPDINNTVVCTPACGACSASASSKLPAACAKATDDTPAPDIIVLSNRDEDCYYSDCTGSALVAVGVLVCWMSMFVLLVWFITDTGADRVPTHAVP